jgi:hypothetical protein
VIHQVADSDYHSEQQNTDFDEIFIHKGENNQVVLTDCGAGLRFKVRTSEGQQGRYYSGLSIVSDTGWLLVSHIYR